MGACAPYFFALRDNMNEVFVRTKEKSRKLAIGLTALFVLSLPFIVAGAVLIGLNIVPILGIVLVVIGIGLFLGNTYAVPNSWQNYKRYQRIEKLIGIVEENKISSFEELKTAMSVSETDLRIMLNYCRKKGFISVSEFEGEVITLEETKEDNQEKDIVCTKCGGTIKYNSDISFCPYCGEKITIDK